MFRAHMCFHSKYHTCSPLYIILICFMQVWRWESRDSRDLRHPERRRQSAWDHFSLTHHLPRVCEREMPCQPHPSARGEGDKLCKQLLQQKPWNLAWAASPQSSGKGTHAEGATVAVDLQAESKNLVDRQVVVVAMDVVYDCYNLMATHNKNYNIKISHGGFIRS